MKTYIMVVTRESVNRIAQNGAIGDLLQDGQILEVIEYPTYDPETCPGGYTLRQVYRWHPIQEGRTISFTYVNREY